MNSKLKKIRDDFLDFEICYSLFNKKLLKYYYWDYIRHWVYWDICEQKKLFQVNWVRGYLKKSKVLLKFFNEFLRLPKYIFEILINKLKYRKKNIDIAIFLDENKSIKDGKYINNNCHRIINSLLNKYNIILIDHSRVDRNFIRSYPCRVINNRIIFLISRLFSYLFPFDIRNKKTIKDLNKIINKRFRTEIDLINIFRKFYLFQYILIKWTQRTIQKYKPKLVLFVDDGVVNYIPQAAKSMGVLSAEIQHGSVTDYELLKNYSNIDANKLLTKPNYILTYGEYWNNKYNINIKKIVIGNPHFNYKVVNENAISRNRLERKSKKKLLFISTLDHRIAIMASEFASSYIGYDVNYKLRKEEYSRWKDIYPSQVIGNDNIRIIDNDFKSIHEIIIDSDFVISSNSTALHEAIELGKKCIVFKGNYWEINEDLITAEIVPLVEDVYELYDIVSKHWNYKPFKGNIYSKYSPETLNNLINKII